MSEKSTVKFVGIGALNLLGLIFITLKLCGVIDWSWWFVTMPFWFGIAFGLLFLVSTFLVFLLGTYLDSRARR